MVDFRDIGQVMLQTKSPEQRGVGGFDNFIKTVRDTIQSEADKKATEQLAREKAEADKFNQMVKLEEEKRKITETLGNQGAVSKTIKKGDEVGLEDVVRLGRQGIQGAKAGQPFIGLTPDIAVSDTPVISQPSPMQPNIENMMPEGGYNIGGDAELPMIKPTSGSGQLYERPIYQPIVNADTKEVSYKQIGTEMASTPAGRYLQMPPQSQELPVGAELGKMEGSSTMINQNLDEAKQIIKDKKLSMTWLKAQMKNPTAVSKSVDQNKVINRIMQVKNRLLNMLSGAAVSTQEYQRLSLQLDPQVGEDTETYFDRLELTRREINEILGASKQSKKEFMKKGGSNTNPTSVTDLGDEELITNADGTVSLKKK